MDPGTATVSYLVQGLQREHVERGLMGVPLSQDLLLGTEGRTAWCQGEASALGSRCPGLAGSILGDVGQIT